VASLASAAAELASQARRVAELLGSGAGSSPTHLALLAPLKAVMDQTDAPTTSMTSPHQKLTLTQAETAALLGVHPRTLQRLRAAGAGPKRITIGTAVRYRRQDVERWLEGKRS